jgi:hypothetical protein
MVSENKQYAYFSISGIFDPDLITNRVGVMPTECWRQGDIHPTTQMERKFSRWSLFSQLDHSRDLEDHVRNVLDQLNTKQNVFQEISNEFGGLMQLVGHFYKYYPGMHFDKRIVCDLAKYELEVDYDFYYLYSENREDTF